MHIRNLVLPVIASAFFLGACKKEDQSATVTNPDDGTCVESMAPSNNDIIEGKYIITYNTSVSKTSGMSDSRLAERSQSLLSSYNIPASRVEGIFGGDQGGFIATLSAEQAAEIKNDAAIRSIEPDRIVKLNVCFTVAAPRLLTWNIKRVGYGNGIGKTAWIIDTGIDFTHPDLTTDSTRSRSFISGISSARDENGHGTHVAGIIGGKNNSFGVLGVASGATLISLRVLGADGTGSLSSIIQALAYVNANARAGDVVNMSIGDESTSPALVQQVQVTASKGIYIAIAAGNESTLANKYSPANANGPNIYTVSAIDSLDRFASFSNYGNDVVDYATPGVMILSTYMGNKYAYMSGTSMAAPHMAGLLLLRGSNITTSGTALNDPDGVPDPIAHY